MNKKRAHILFLMMAASAAIMATEIATETATDSLGNAQDSIIVSAPEWYIAPDIPEPLRAPRHTRTATASCSKVEAVLNYDINEVLTEGTYYEYDAAGRTTSTTVWKFNSDGSVEGKSKQEYRFDESGTQTGTTAYTWDNATKDWGGTEKYEYAYGVFAGEKKMIASTTFAWLNNEWIADTRLTYNYDEAGRPTEYYEYHRNSANELIPSSGWIQNWYNDTQKTLDIQYTAYSNGTWSAGTKEEWTYNTSGLQTLHEKFDLTAGGWSVNLQESTTYAGTNIAAIENYQWINGTKTGMKKEEHSFSNDKETMAIIYTWSNGAWVGSSKEIWEFNGPSAKQTLHEKFSWFGNDWALTLQERTVYTGNYATLIENYKWENGVKIGTNKEEHSFSNDKETMAIIYAWADTDWVGSSKEVWNFTSGKQTLHETYEWAGSDWAILTQENTTYTGSNITAIENYEWVNGIKTGTQKEEATYSGSTKTMSAIYTWSNGAWVGSSKEVWNYISGNLTLHETYGWADSDWAILTQENTTYTGTTIIAIENYEWVNGVKTGTQKEEYAYTGSDKTQTIAYAWNSNAWIESTKEIWGYTSGKQTLHETYGWAAADWAILTQEINAYNAAGNEILSESSTWTDGVRSGKRTSTTYNSANAITEILRQNWSVDAADWVNAARSLNTYNADGVNIMNHISSWDGTKWVLYSMTRTDIIKDAAGRQLLKASWECGSDSIWSGVKKDTAAYTATGKPLYTATYNSWANNDWAPYSKTEYTYDAAGHQTLLLQYEGKNGVWVNKTKTEQTYDADGNQTLLQGFNWSNNNWVGSYKYEYGYDAAGHQTMQAHYEWLYGQWSGFSRSDTEYDAAGNVSATISFKWKNNNWVGNSRTENVYDAKKRLIEYTLKKWQSNKWVNSRHYIYLYDEYDRLYSSRKYWWYNAEWTIYEIDDKEYDLSNNKLRRELFTSWLDNEIESFSDKRYYYSCDPHFYTVRFENYDGKILAYQIQEEGNTPAYNGTTPTQPETPEFTYEFTGWSPSLSAVADHTTYQAAYNATKKSYTITWNNEDGTLIDQTTVLYGETPTHANPTKDATAQYTYTFKGWDAAPVAVTGEATYTATFSSTVNKYLVTFKNEDGAVLKSETLDYGAMPTAPVAPTKDATAQYTYTFKSWDNEIASVIGEATYTAIFDSTVNKYLITFKNDETTLQSTEVAYGVTPEYTGTTPVKQGNAQYTYTFKGWDIPIATVTKDTTYTATFSSTVNKYLVTFKNEDGAVLKSETLDYGAMPTAPVAPTKDATAQYTYTFKSWDNEIASVIGEATYTAIFDSTVNKYLITFKNDETTLQSTEVAYGVTPEYTGTTPVKQGNAQYTYTFKGWDIPIATVTKDTTYTATFSSTVNKYLVTFKNEDGAVLKSETLEYGATPVAPADPTKAATAQYSYAFAGWDKTIAAVTGEATYTATYTETQKGYTITWRNDDGSLIEETIVEFGSAPAHANINKESTDQYTFVFKGWSPVLAPVSGDATYTAVFDTIVNTYTVTFYFEDGITVLDQVTVAYGETPSTHLTPSEPMEEHYYYTFAGWSPEIVPVTGEASYTAVFTRKPKDYTITFRNYDKTLLQTAVFPYGGTPVYSGEEPARKPNAQYTYTFAGWSPEIAAVTGDATYTARFDDELNSYTVKWLNEDGTELDRQTVEYGAMPVYDGETPAKEADDQYIYTFKGWTPAVVRVTRDATYRATYTSQDKSQALEDVQGNNVQCTKILRGDQIYILRGDKIYTLQGVEVEE